MGGQSRRVPAFQVAVVILLGACAEDPAPPAAPIDPFAREETKPVDKPVEKPPPQPVVAKDSVVIVDLGAVTAGQTVELDVPSTAIGFNVTVASGGNGKMGIQKVVNPAGELVFSSFAPVGGDYASAQGLDGMASASVPQTDHPAAAIRAGKWKITVAGDGTSGHADARLQSTSDGKFHGGTLDVHLHVPIGLQIGKTNTRHVVSAESAPNDTAIKDRLDVFFAGLKQAFGVDRGKVSFHEVPAAYTVLTKTTMATATRITERLSDEQALHILLTNDLAGHDLLGFSPGIPGAATRTGTPISGVMAALYEETEIANDGYTWLHEMGHFVGLQHTSEEDGVGFDPLSDTPKCPGTRTPDCPDELNLMTTGSWPAAGTVPPVTPGQQLVVRGSPIFRAVAAATNPGARRVTTPLATSSEIMLKPASVTRSGRPLNPTERWLVSSFCGSATQDPQALVAARGPQALAELEAAANDPDLPSLYRSKAGRIIDRFP